MAPSTSNFMLSMKFVVISIGAVSLGMATKASVPLLSYEFPNIWSSLNSWLKPPYLYVVLNGIIIIIAATSRSHRKEHSSDQSEPLVCARTPVASELTAVSQPQQEILPEPEEVEVRSVVAANEEEAENNEFVVANSVSRELPEVERELLQRLVSEKPLVSSRFTHRKLPTRMNPEGVKSLGVARVKKQETLESTWKKITEGRHVPLTRHLKNTWQNHEEIKKTLEPSPSQDELNRRVEAFIKKFNDEMRIQRQESLQQYMEMINRGV